MAAVEDVLKSQVDSLKLEVHTLKAKAGAENISIGNYLLTRLAQLHVKVHIPTCSSYLSMFNLLFRLCSVYQVILTWGFW